MDFQILNVYSKEIADAITNYLTENKLLTKRHSNTYWNKDEKLTYFYRSKSFNNYNFEDEPDLESSVEGYTVIVFDDIVEVRYFAQCYEDETDMDTFEGIDCWDIPEALNKISIVIEKVFGKKLNLQKYKSTIIKANYNDYMETLHANDGNVYFWDKSFNDYVFDKKYGELPVFCSEDFNEFKYVLTNDFLTEETYYNVYENWEEIQNEFEENIIKTGNINKIEIVCPDKVNDLKQTISSQPITSKAFDSKQSKVNISTNKILTTTEKIEQKLDILVAAIEKLTANTKDIAIRYDKLIDTLGQSAGGRYALQQVMEPMKSVQEFIQTAIKFVSTLQSYEPKDQLKYIESMLASLKVVDEQMEALEEYIGNLEKLADED